MKSKAAYKIPSKKIDYGEDKREYKYVKSPGMDKPQFKKWVSEAPSATQESADMHRSKNMRQNRKVYKDANYLVVDSPEKDLVEPEEEEKIDR